MLVDILSSKLEQRKQEGNLRRLTTVTGLIDFCSNDYLGLAKNRELTQLIDSKVNERSRQNGSTGSRLITGNSEYIETVENKLADIFRAESALLFNSGYDANVGVLSSLPQKGDTVLYDEKCHASIKDGARLSLASRHPFRHNDLNDLEGKIARSSGNKFIVVESIYSMDGDRSPLMELVELANRNKCHLILDEAHSTGIMGPQGSGMATMLSVHREIPVRIYTFGKAMGVHGACVVGPVKLRDYLINFSRPFIYSTAPDVHSVAAIDAAFEILNTNIQLQNELQVLVKFYNQLTISLGDAVRDSPIQTVSVSGNDNAKSIAEKIRKEGFDVRAILSPTIPKGSERLRICLHTYNSTDEIAKLADVLKTNLQS